MKDPAFLLYFQDFLMGTQFFSDEEVGAYFRLLCHQADRGHLGLSDVIEICKSSDRTWEKVSAKFQRDRDGKFFNKRLEFEIERRRKYSKSRSLNRLHKNHMKNISHSCERHIETETETSFLSVPLSESKDKSKSFPAAPQPEQEVYAVYPKRVDRGQALKAIRGALKKIGFDDLLEKVRRYAELAKDADPQFIPNPATWFNGERWLDEAAPPRADGRRLSADGKMWLDKFNNVVGFVEQVKV